MQSSLMVVASLIATVGFQVGVNPPGGVWQETKYFNETAGIWQQDEKDINFDLVYYDHVSKIRFAGMSVIADESPYEFRVILGSNTLGLLASMSIILLLRSGLPVKSRIFMWMLMVIMWVAISSMALTYAFAISYMTAVIEWFSTVVPLPKKVLVKDDISTYYITLWTVYGWFGLMALILFSHFVRLLLKYWKRRLYNVGPLLLRGPTKLIGMFKRRRMNGGVSI
uniref:PGG domain-containing protein n=1 Tax=Nelumbo nucifera TaxID=4432 RepID=A0A822Z929_NELNU|nr:TPA_asm: hypothetical protein HUJ06_001044 [Nelumbo nucifera]